VWRHGHLHKAGRSHRIVAEGAWRSVVPDGTFVEHGTVLAVRGGEVAAAKSEAASASEGGPPPGTAVVRADTDGTVYLRPDPASPAFAAEGADVARAATLALVEVMKTFTPVRAPAAGTIVRVLCEDTGAVRAGDALVWIRTERSS
jgi:acetyl-CoA carboxylase biotin carboxyl carrier protein